MLGSEGSRSVNSLTSRDFNIIYYQSMEDWRAGSDLVRCNPSFHGQKHQDVVLMNMTNTSVLTFARIFALLERHFNDSICRKALVSVMNRSSWKPKTPWENCVIREQTRDFGSLILVRSFEVLISFPRWFPKSLTTIISTTSLMRTGSFVVPTCRKLAYQNQCLQVSPL